MFDYMSITNQFNQWLKGEDEKQGIVTLDRGSPPARRSPLQGKDFLRFEQVNYPKDRHSGKKLAVLGKVGKSQKVHFKFRRGNLVACH